MAEPKHPHDALFKKTFSVPEHAAAALRAVLPTSLVERLDFSTLSLCSGSFVDDTLAGSESDLLFSVLIEGKPGFLYFLFEHQSTPPPLMPLRLTAYVVRILQRHVDEAHAAKRDPLPLPLVVPVVLHHGKQGWTAARSLEDLFDSDSARAAGVGHLVPRLSFVLDDLSYVSDAELESRVLGLVPALTLWALRDARTPDRLERSIQHWAKALGELWAAPNGAEALATIFRYIAVVADDSVLVTLAQALESTQPQVKDALMTIAEKWFADGEAKGRVEGEAKGRVEGEAKGRVEGEAKGRVEGKAEMLRRLLALKFGTAAEQAKPTIAVASEVELDCWLERVLTAPTLAAVLGP